MAEESERNEKYGMYEIAVETKSDMTGRSRERM